MASDAHLIDRIREGGPITVAAFMELALYDPTFGYYARASRQSGAAGDFFTSVDTGPLFGRLLGRQVAEMATHLHARRAFSLVDAGASDGRLMRDMLHGLADTSPSLLSRTHANLVERSAAARAAQASTIGPLAVASLTSSEVLPPAFCGVLVANELLDAFPAHLVVQRGRTLCEYYVGATASSLILREGPPSSPELESQLRASGVTLADGQVTEVSPAMCAWVRAAAHAVEQGFLMLIDYGHHADVRYGPDRLHGTLSAFARHCVSGPHEREAWLRAPGTQDLTTDVDFTAVRLAAEAEGCEVLGFMDQTYFLMALAGDWLARLPPNEQRAFKTLVLPGGLGSTMKVMVLGRNVGRPSLRGCSGLSRLT